MSKTLKCPQCGFEFSVVATGTGPHKYNPMVALNKMVGICKDMPSIKDNKECKYMVEAVRSAENSGAI